MKTMKLVLFFCSVLIIFTIPAYASENYIALSGGMWSPTSSSTIDYNIQPLDISYGAGWQLGAAIGVGTESGFRLENELTYMHAPAKSYSENMYALAWMLNAWWDIRNGTRFTPYLGGGVGVARGSMASPGPVDNSGSCVAYQLGGGVDFQLIKGWSLDLGYRHIGTIGSIDNSNGVFKLSGTSITSGLRLRF